ncbi:MAG: hypothetical protein LBG86_00220, partial [Puniceicoccales bacterium]|nr:hypothetical protein [Puniceicoccales bacterium]
MVAYAWDGTIFNLPETGEYFYLYGMSLLCLDNATEKMQVGIWNSRNCCWESFHSSDESTVESMDTLIRRALTDLS